MCFLYDWWMTRIKILVVEVAGYYLILPVIRGSPICVCVRRDVLK